MQKRIAFGLVFSGVVVGVIVASFFLSVTPLPAGEPTRVPVPTFTPTPGGVIGDYATLATQYQQALAQAMTDVGQLLATPKLTDAAWQAQVATAMDDVDGAYSLLVRLQPGDEWLPFHQEMIAGAADCSAAMRVLDLALEDEDRNAVAVVGALLGRCQSHLTAAGQLVEDGKPITQ